MRNHNGRAQRQTICSRIKQVFRGPQKQTRSELGTSTTAKHQSEHKQAPGPYVHVPTAASSSFLRTTTKRDMFELTGSGRKQPISGEPSVENLQALQALEKLQALGDLSEDHVRHWGFGCRRFSRDSMRRRHGFWRDWKHSPQCQDSLGSIIIEYQLLEAQQPACEGWVRVRKLNLGSI